MIENEAKEEIKRDVEKRGGEAGELGGKGKETRVDDGGSGGCRRGGEGGSGGGREGSEVRITESLEGVGKSDGAEEGRSVEEKTEAVEGFGAVDDHLQDADDHLRVVEGPSSIPKKHLTEGDVKGQTPVVDVVENDVAKDNRESKIASTGNTATITSVAAELAENAVTAAATITIRSIAAEITSYAVTAATTKTTIGSIAAEITENAVTAAATQVQAKANSISRQEDEKAGQNIERIHSR